MAINRSLRRKRSKSVSPHRPHKHNSKKRSRSVGRHKRGGMLSGLMKQLAVPAALVYAQKRVQNKVRRGSNHRTKRNRRSRKN